MEESVDVDKVEDDGWAKENGKAGGNGVPGREVQ